MSTAATPWHDRVRAGAAWWESRRPRRGATSLLFWFAVSFLALSGLRLLPGTAGVLCAVLQVLVGLLLLVVGVPTAWRAVRQRLLWSLRNKLILTYLLIGLAPVVLFVTLVLVSAYVAAGQFAIHLADTRLRARMDQLTGLNTLDSQVLEERLRLTQHRNAEAASRAIAGPQTGELAFVEPSLERRAGTPQPTMNVYLNGQYLPDSEARRSTARTPLGVPPWATQLRNQSFQGLVMEGRELYLVAIRQVQGAPGKSYSVVSSVAIDQALMRDVAEGLGRTTFSPAALRVEDTRYATTAGSSQGKRLTRRAPSERETEAALRTGTISGGTLPSRASLLDFHVHFLSTLPIVDWDTGTHSEVTIQVDSRPSTLYHQLFGPSLGGIVTEVVRIALMVLCTIFAGIEALALWMAVRLSRTVTASVTDLYAATQRIDRGDLRQTIPVERDDQMADLSRSFNTMMGSLQRLLEAQKASQRLQNEVSIAQEVQANLFPREEITLPALELHGVCRPARGVSGDYYDFLVYSEDGARIRGEDAVSAVGIALGDISGKGISAALLMATLHSAVRAYRLASQEMLRGSREQTGEEAECAEVFEEPGKILALLNHHLFRSTQPEKYATLFLAHYASSADGAGSLTYANAGQLPPLLLRQDGSVQRLDCGGTVVGLMDGMSYEQETVRMLPGDIMVAYSDGVTEPENDFGEFGEERLVEVVRAYQDAPLHVISAQVLQALDAWIGAEEQPDDITLVLARQR